MGGRVLALRPLLAALLIALCTVSLPVWPVHGEDGLVGADIGSYRPIGRIVAPHGAGLMFTDAQSGTEEQLAVVPPVGVSGHVTWSPDGARLAFSRFGRRPGERIGGSDILMVPSVGGEALPLVQHDLDGALLGAPVWMPDGSGIYFDALPPAGGARDSQVMYAALDGSNSLRAVTRGNWPAVSPDGRLLAYVRPGRDADFANELVLTDVAGTFERILVPADELVQITSPRFSPGGQEIAFIGSVSRGEATLTPGLTDLFMKGVMAHGPPGDIWIIGLQGQPARRMTTFDEDEPTLSWSPDGAWIAMLGGGGLYLMPRDLSEPPRQLGRGGFGGIDWR